jgi:predicted P-loop ATPase
MLLDVTKVMFKDSHVRDAMVHACLENPENELTSWLEGLRWDGVRRVDRLFPNYFQTEDSEYAEAVGRTFCIAAVSRALTPGSKVDTVPILIGKQGHGKSTGVKLLTGVQWFRDSYFDIKDHRRVMGQLSGVWVYEIGEMASFATKADQELLKAFISSCEDSGVPPYGREVVTKPRSVVFVATSNDDQPLRDRTGNRRFQTLQVGDRVDLDGIVRDREQIWAEAVHLFRTGESWVLPESLWEEAARVQSERVMDDPWVDILRAKLNPGVTFVTLADLVGDRYLALGSRASNPDCKRIKACMLQLGWNKFCRNGVRGYER